MTAALVLRELRRHHFAVLSTVRDDASTDSAGVSYGMSRSGPPHALYVMTRRHLRKARSIAANPNVSLVVPLTRRMLWFLPPATIQLRGRAEILGSSDVVGNETFRTFWMGRRIRDAYAESQRRGETRVCFLRIRLEPTVRTYLVGSSIWAARRRMESAAAKVVLPSAYRKGGETEER